MPTREEILQSLVAPSQVPAPDTHCDICYEMLTDPVQLPCQFGHIFCRECVTDWLHSPESNTCPKDREELFDADWAEEADEGDDYDDDDQQAVDDARWQLRRWMDRELSDLIVKVGRALESLEHAPPTALRDEVQNAIYAVLDAIPVPGASDSADVFEFLEDLAGVRDRVVDAVQVVHRAENQDPSTYREVGARIMVITGRVLTARNAAPLRRGQ